MTLRVWVSNRRPDPSHPCDRGGRVRQLDSLAGRVTDTAEKAAERVSAMFGGRSLLLLIDWEHQSQHDREAEGVFDLPTPC